MSHHWTLTILLFDACIQNWECDVCNGTDKSMKRWTCQAAVQNFLYPEVSSVVLDATLACVSIVYIRYCQRSVWLNDSSLLLLLLDYISALLDNRHHLTHWCMSSLTNNTVCNLPSVVQEAEVSSFQCFPRLLVRKFVSARRGRSVQVLMGVYGHATCRSGLQSTSFQLTWQNEGDHQSLPPSSPVRWDPWPLRDVNIPRP